MKLYIGQDFAGNVHITDERDALPPDLITFDEVYLPWRERFADTEHPTLEIQVQDYADSVSLRREDF